MSTKLVVFDIDGTILNTFAGIRLAVNHMRNHLGLAPLDDITVRSKIGLDIDRFIKECVPEREIDNIAELNAIRLQALNSNPNLQALPYDGVPELLTRLQDEGIQLAVLTNKAYDSAIQNCQKFFGNIHFQVIKGDRVGFDRKPSPKELLDIIDTVGVAKQETIFVGDSELDVLCAKNAGVQCVAVLWGFRDKAELQEAGATVFAITAQELYDGIIQR